jgi:hypothetical protein
MTGGNGRQNITVPLIRDERGGFRTCPARCPTKAGGWRCLRVMRWWKRPLQPVPLPKMDIGHVLIVGETGAGKSTAMRALLAHRQQVVVLDPHAGPGDWPGGVVKGSGRNFTEIGEFMEYMIDELSKRAEQRRQGVNQFMPMTVATDEMPAIASELGPAVYQNWQKWMREGRKFGLYIVVSTQSTRVKTMGSRARKTSSTTSPALSTWAKRPLTSIPIWPPRWNGPPCCAPSAARGRSLSPTAQTVQPTLPAV